MRRSDAESRLEAGSVAALLCAAMLIASLFWMAYTGNRFCCDGKSLVRQVIQQLFVPAP
jgi:hypothetical protein